MLAHAFLAVVRAEEHARHPAPDGLISLTCNEIQRLFTALVRPTHDAATGSAGRPGDAAIRPEPEPAITADKPRISREDHDLQLEYEACGDDRRDEHDTEGDLLPAGVQERNLVAGWIRHGQRTYYLAEQPTPVT